MYIYKLLFTLVLACFICSGKSFAQENYGNIPLDSLFQRARKLAFGGNREEARKICNYIAGKDSTYRDVLILAGRTYAWDGKYEEAKQMFNIVLKAKPSYTDALMAMIDLCLWSDDYTCMLEYANKGLKYYPQDKDFILRKAKAMYYLNKNNTKQSLMIADSLIKAFPEWKEAEDFHVKLIEDKRINKIGLSYECNFFHT